jgi:large subunit ribosomal protein L29
VSKTGTHLEQLRDLPDIELRQTLARTRDELFRLHLGTHTNQVTSTAAVAQKRREIARILTILRARSLGGEVQGQKPQSARPDQPDKQENA